MGTSVSGNQYQATIQGTGQQENQQVNTAPPVVAPQISELTTKDKITKAAENKQYLIIAAVVIVVIVTAFFIFKKK